MYRMFCVDDTARPSGYPEKLISLLKDQYTTQYRRQCISMDIKDVTKIAGYR